MSKSRSNRAKKASKQRAQRRAAKAKATESKSRRPQRPDGPDWRVRLHDIIFEHDTPAGWAFDVALLIAIIFSVIAVALETVPSFAMEHRQALRNIEYFLTGLFTIEYVLRLISARHPLKYAFSFWGIIDLLSILPTYVGLVWTDRSVESFVILRSIRLLRVFRVMKLWRMMKDADELSHAIWSARNKIVVFLTVIMVAVTVSGSLMFFIESEFPVTVIDEQGNEVELETQFTSIPQSMYWAIVTMTTVGYGDVVPRTTPGKIISAALILLGYSLIIVPSGFVSAELTSRRSRKDIERAEDDEENVNSSIECEACGQDEHLIGSQYCHECGNSLA